MYCQINYCKDCLNYYFYLNGKLVDTLSLSDAYGSFTSSGFLPTTYETGNTNLQLIPNVQVVLQVWI